MRVKMAFLMSVVLSVALVGTAIYASAPPSEIDGLSRLIGDENGNNLEGRGSLGGPDSPMAGEWEIPDSASMDEAWTSAELLPVDEIEAIFDYVKAEQQRVVDFPPLIDQNGIRITAAEFITHRTNVSWIQDLFDGKTVETVVAKEQILGDLLGAKLIEREAREQGLVADNEALNTLIEAEKRNYEALSIDNDVEEAWTKVLLDNRIRITGQSVEDYFASEEVRAQYEGQLLSSQLYLSLVKIGKVNNAEEWVDYVARLVENNKECCSIEWSDIE